MSEPPESLTVVHRGDVRTEDSGDYAPGGSKDHQCRWCPKIFTDEALLKSHMENHHMRSEYPESKKKEGSGRLLCAKPDCNKMLVSYDALCIHCAEEHGLTLQHHTHRFDTVDDFKSWLTDLASVAGSMVKRRGERRTAEGTTMGDYHCVFDGKKRETPSTRAPDRHPYNRRIPSKKLGFSCPAFIRYQVLVDETVMIRAQLQHFGHALKPVDDVPRKLARGASMMGRRPSTMGRRKDKRRGYAFDSINYDEINSLSTNDLVEEDRVEIDDEGLVNLLEFPALERAKFLAQSSCASMDLQLAEVQAIPHENLPRIGILIDKLHEISATASMIESLVKELSSISPSHHSLIEEISAKRKMLNASSHSNGMRPLENTIKEEEEEGGDVKGSRLDEDGSHEGESFEHHSESGEMEYHEDTVAEEVVVDEDGDYVEERPESNEAMGDKIRGRR